MSPLFNNVQNEETQAKKSLLIVKKCKRSKCYFCRQSNCVSY